MQFLQLDNEAFDQTARMRMLICLLWRRRYVSSSCAPRKEKNLSENLLKHLLSLGLSLLEV